MSLSEAQRARMERQRERARALRAAVLPRPGSRAPAVDTGGGFLLEPEAAAPPPAPAPQPPAPPPLRADWPHCERCERPFPASFLLEHFDCAVCDACRDDDGEHALLTRTEAKAEFLLKDCDLDSRPPPLRFLRRRNPHRGGGDMRLYLRAQVEARAAEAWGGADALRAEAERREARRAEARGAAQARRLRELRRAVRPPAARAPHRHRWGPERPAPDAGPDAFQRDCLDCPHTELFEKM